MAYRSEDFKITNVINYLRKSRRDEERERKTGEDTLYEQERLMTKILDDLGYPYIQRKEIASGDSIDVQYLSRLLVN